MPEDNADIDALVREIEKVQKRIEHYPKIRHDEERTRHFLIDPLLKALGWDDPLVMTPEYKIKLERHNKSPRVDYALHPREPGQPVAFIETKRMGMNIDIVDKPRKQAFEYAKNWNSERDSVEYVGLTNGDRWIFYKRGVDRPVLDLSISSDSPRSCAEQLLRFKLGGELFKASREIPQERMGNTLILMLEGRVDGANARDFQVGLEEAIDGSETAVILDLEQLSYISSAGLRVILLMMAATLRNQSAEFAVCSLSESIREIFAISGFDKIVNIHDSKDEALAALDS